jgi:hypothetical protein
MSYAYRKRMTQHRLILIYVPSAVACTKIKLMVSSQHIYVHVLYQLVHCVRIQCIASSA